MQICQFGLSHDVAPVALRERVAFSVPGVQEALAQFLGLDPMPEVVLLSTCNRTELYVASDDPMQVREAFVAYLARDRWLAPEDAMRIFTWREGQEAINHLLRVAGGLESQILGEGQILGQVRDASAAARLAGTLGPILDGLFRHAVAAGKRVRSETTLAQGAVSVGSAAVELAKEDLGGLDGRAVLLVGAGKLGELALKQLASQGVSRIVVANRTLESANELAAIVGGEAIPFHSMRSALCEVDVVLCCTGAPHYVLTRSDLAPIVAERGGRPLVLVDVSVPRNLDPELATLPGVRLHDIDDLAAVAQRNRGERECLVPEVEAILADELAGFDRFLSSYQAAPTIASLRHKLESLRQTEFERFISKLGEDLGPDQVAAVEALTRAITAKFLHEPTVGLKANTAGLNEIHASAIRDLFGLPAPSRKKRAR